jgi:hypothetical protein
MPAALADVTVPLTVKVPLSWRELIANYAESIGDRSSAVVRRAIAEHLAKEGITLS